MAESTGSDPSLDALRDKALRLVRYLQEYVGLQSRVTRDVDDYRNGIVLWLESLPNEVIWAGRPGLEDTDLGDTWIEVRKPSLPKMPAPPVEVLPWLDPVALERFDGPDPALRPEIPDPDWTPSRRELVPPSLRLNDRPRVRPLWIAYLPRWREWAAERRRKEAVQSVYSRLFEAFQQQSKLGEAFEAVVGIGLLSWAPPSGQAVRRHILAAQAELRFDATRGTLTIACPPQPEGARLHIEDEYLEATDRPPRKAYEEAERRIAEIGDALWSRDAIDGLLDGWVNSLRADAVYDPSQGPTSRPTDVPVVRHAPALILRPRSLRGTQLAYRRIQEQLEAGGPLPIGLARLVDHVSGDHVAEPGAIGPGGSAPTNGETYFPLPANDEQLRIAHDLGLRQGVLVQGPPGTGKSQTIANLVCHLLARGQRVLITSETPRALKVLKGKIPEVVQPLCVSLLGADSASFSELERSVTGISQRLSAWSPERQVRIVVEREKELDQVRRDAANVARQLREIREAETHEVTSPDGDYRGRAWQIAKRIGEERTRFGWLALDPTAPVQCPLTALQARRCLEWLRARTPARDAELQKDLVDPGSIPAPARFADLVAAERAAAEHLSAHENVQGHDAFKALSRSSEVHRKAVREAISHLLGLLGHLQHRPEPWVAKALEHSLAGRESLTRRLAADTRCLLEAVEPLFQAVGNTLVDIPPDHTEVQVLADATTILSHLKAGGGWGWAIFRPEVVRPRLYLRTGVRIDGHLAKDVPVLERLVQVLTLRRKLDELRKLWGEFSPPADRPPSLQVPEFEENLECLDVILLAYQATRSLEQALSAAGAGGSQGGHGREQVLLLQRVLEAIDARSTLALAREATAGGAALLKQAASDPTSHPLITRLTEAVDARDPRLYAERYEELQALRAEQANHREMALTYRQLAEVSPTFRGPLLHSPADPIWNERMEHLGAAWHWAVASRWLAQREEPGYVERLVTDQQRLEKRQRQILAELAAEKAWSTFLGRLAPRERESLNAWRLAVKKIGKGTGKLADQYRAAARGHMKGCIHAIPAWIMPRYRVAEVLNLEPELFDVVIIDEASQTGIDGMFLYYLGKRMVVVGDDQQIAPSAVGIPIESVNALTRRHLDGVSHRDALYPTNSVYDHAAIRFQSKIVLTEHFRCMPEIIQFSNDLCYAPHGTPLLPLRVYPPDRLDPVVSRFVTDGYQKGASATAENLPEAEALVLQVLACCEDPRYEGRSFGVISLVGEAQARLIQQMLIQRLGPQQMEQRQIVCGDAYAFQGDERDVMFLSLVSAPNARIGAQANAGALQRYNVAASRARDQMWLFHSVRLEDLSRESMGYRLLDYALNPRRMDLEGQGDTFDSEFERDVCLRIRGRGFFVRTQVPAGDQQRHRYRIDLVVEGLRARMAVECDGDQWHGPDRYEKDMARQRQLERSGWRFVRVRGGSFYADPEQALRPVWDGLSALGIEPGTREAPLPCPPPPAGNPATLSVSPPSAPPPNAIPMRRVNAPAPESSTAAATETSPESPAPRSPAPRFFSGPDASQAVRLGDTVVYFFEPGKDQFVTIVEGSSDPDRRLANVETALARAFLGAYVGEKVDVPLPKGSREATVVQVIRPK